MGNRMRRGRKIKIGGDVIQQAPKNNSPTIKGSVKGTYSQLKAIIDKIILFIKSNFIFTLLTAILIIVYIYFFTTDVVTEEDLKQDEIKLTCDTYGDTCPTGKTKLGSDYKCISPDLRKINNISDLKKKAHDLGADDKVDNLDNMEDIISLIRELPDNDLADFKCSEANCCVDITQCNNYKCPTGYSPNKDNMVCSKGVCGNDDCCTKNCIDFPIKACSGGVLIKDNLCEGDICEKSECCIEKKTCGTTPFNCEVLKKINKKDPGKINCPANKCDATVCCDDPSQPAVPSAGASAGSKQGASAGSKQGATPTDENTCADHKCGAFPRKPEVRDKLCVDFPGKKCNDSLCCDTS
jgi:hypothetical protein